MFGQDHVFAETKFPGCVRIGMRPVTKALACQPRKRIPFVSLKKSQCSAAAATPRSMAYVTSCETERPRGPVQRHSKQVNEACESPLLSSLVTGNVRVDPTITRLSNYFENALVDRAHPSHGRQQRIAFILRTAGNRKSCQVFFRNDA